MNETQSPQNDEIRRLLVEAGPPLELPADDLRRIRRAAKREWRGQSVTPIFEGRSSRTLLAIAASLVLVLTAVWLYRADRSPIASATVATIELLREAPEGGSRFVVGDELVAGAELSTAAGDSTERLALRMASGHSVRLDADSKIRLASATRLELEYGAVYVDSGATGAAYALEIATPMGTVREVGTQYEVRVDGTVRVRVREGSVSLSHSGRTFSATRGEQLTVGTGGEVDRSTVPIAGQEWAWVLETAPSPDVEGRPLEPYVDWLSRETGWPVRYEDGTLESHGAELVYGKIDNLTPEQSLSVILPGSGLGYRFEDGTLVITRTDK